MKKIASILILTLLTQTACGTIMTGTSQKVTFDSDPPGATVTVNGYRKATTPAVLDLPKTETYTATFKKDCYESAMIPVDRQFNFVSLFNILLPGWILWFAVDGLSGGLYKLTPEHVYANLDKAQCGK